MTRRNYFLVFAAMSSLLAACNRTGPEAARGRELAVRYGCAACHDIPNMPTIGRVGPPLKGIARRTYVAGRLQNTPENMARWIRTPRQVDPHTAMPDMGVSEEEGRDITAFLYTLR